MMLAVALALAAVVAAPSPSSALDPDLTVSVTDPAGVPVVAAVVTVIQPFPVTGPPTVLNFATDANGLVTTGIFGGSFGIVVNQLEGSQTYRDDLARSAFDAPQSGVSDGTPLVLDLVIPFLDEDSDGIPTAIECEPEAAGAFCDPDGGGHTGEVTENSTGELVSFIDLPDPDGVRIVTAGSSGQVKVHVCGSATLTIPAGGDVDVTCGSVTVGVRSGGPVVVVPDATTYSEVSIPQGVTAKIGDVVDGRFTLEHLGGVGEVIVTVDGVTTSVHAGDPVLEVTDAPADGTPPDVTILGFVDGQVFDIGEGPTPSCRTEDAVSGVDTSAELGITGGNADGSGVFTVTCTGAADNAGNTAEPVLATYEVHYILAPGVFTGSVASAPAINTGKGGSTFPLRWTLRDADGDLKTDLATVESISFRRTGCDGLTGGESEVMEASATGGGLSVTGSGDYKFNWKSPKHSGCGVLSIHLVDGNTLRADFSLR